jgi:hypothetical protein
MVQNLVCSIKILSQGDRGDTNPQCASVAGFLLALSFSGSGDIDRGGMGERRPVTVYRKLSSTSGQERHVSAASMRLCVNCVCSMVNIGNRHHFLSVYSSKGDT